MAWYEIFQWIRTSIAKKPYIFQGGGGVRTPCPPLDPRMSFDWEKNKSYLKAFSQSVSVQLSMISDNVPSE